MKPTYKQLEKALEAAANYLVNLREECDVENCPLATTNMPCIVLKNGCSDKDCEEAIKEAKATPYVKPYIENGKHVGYKSSDGYHVKYWRLADSALEKAKQHAKVDTVSENSLAERVKAIMEGKK